MVVGVVEVFKVPSQDRVQLLVCVSVELFKVYVQDRVQQRLVDQNMELFKVYAQDSVQRRFLEMNMKLIFKVFAQDRVQQRCVEQNLVIITIRKVFFFQNRAQQLVSEVLSGLFSMGTTGTCTSCRHDLAVRDGWYSSCAMPGSTVDTCSSSVPGYFWTYCPFFYVNSVLKRLSVLLSCVWVLRREEKCAQTMLQLLFLPELVALGNLDTHHFHASFVSDSHLLAFRALPEKSFWACVNHRRVEVSAQQQAVQDFMAVAHRKVVTRGTQTSAGGIGWHRRDGCTRRCGRRRRQRPPMEGKRMRSWWRREQQSVRAAVAKAFHHSSFRCHF